MKLQRQDSVPRSTVRAIVPHQARSQVVPQWHQTAVKFQRIRCTICFTSPNTKETTPAGKGHACCLLSCMSCLIANAEAAVETEVSECLAQLHTKEQITGVPGTTGTAGHRKMVQNSKANCCDLLRWITKLKCVNSEFKTVDTHPEKGCLKWLHGTMSEPPWKSH